MDIKLDGALNIRDLGGMVTKYGGRVASRRLIRSDMLADITEADEKKLLEVHKLSRIVDLRTDNELLEQEAKKIDGAVWIHLPLIKGDSEERENAAKKAGEGRTVAENRKMSLSDIFRVSIAQMDHDVPSAMTGMYKSLMSSEYSISQTNSFFRLLISAKEGATLWHCTAGKDRTGYLTILLLELLGVDRKEIERDYLLSESNLKSQTEHIISEIKKETDDPGLLKQVRILNGVLPEYIATVFETIDDNGGIEEYMIRVVGLSGSDINDIREMYIETN